jgi:hypothetical protein
VRGGQAGVGRLDQDGGLAGDQLRVQRQVFGFQPADVSRRPGDFA